MKKCLITKLNQKVLNDSSLKFGEMENGFGKETDTHVDNVEE